MLPFQLSSKEVIVLCGGGGKTTTMYALAKALAQKKRRIIVTTTTKIMQPTAQQVDRLIDGDEKHILDTLRQEGAPAPGEIVAVLSDVQHNKKALGIDPHLCDTLFYQDYCDYLIVEADGAARKPFKAPADHEPVIPDTCTTLMYICGIDAVDKPLDPQYCHRPERIQALTGLAFGQLVTEQAVAQVVASPQGGKKGYKPGMRFIAMINKADDSSAVNKAVSLAGEMLAAGVEETVVSAVGCGRMAIIHRRRKPVAGIILAAGRSSRMGVNKLLLPWNNGNTVLDEVIKQASAAGISPLYLVSGAERERIEKIAATQGISSVFNADYAAGQSTSLQAGLRLLDDHMAAMYILGDQPLIPASIYRRVLKAYQLSDKDIVVPCLSDGRRGNPTIFGPNMRRDIKALQGDIGARPLIKRYESKVDFVPIEDFSICIDIDSREQYEKYRRDICASID